MPDTRDRYFHIILEEIRDMLRTLNEGFDTFRDLPARVTSLENCVDRMDVKLDVHTAAIKDMSSVLQNHEARITKLETA